MFAFYVFILSVVVLLILSALGTPALQSRHLLGGGAGAVQDAGGGADIHVQGDAVVGVAGHAGHVGGIELPGEQGGGAEHVPQAVPGPLAAAVGVTPAGG